MGDCKHCTASPHIQHVAKAIAEETDQGNVYVMACKELVDAEQRGEDKAAKRILDFAKKLNFGPTLRTFIKKVGRGEHLEG